MRPNKIFIDGLGLVEGHFSGVGQYILGIVRGLDEIIEKEKYGNKKPPRICVIIPYDTKAKFLDYNFKNIEFKLFPLSFKLMSALWRRGRLPPIDLWCGKGFYIFPRFVSMPLLFSKSSALVIYDLSYELYRQYSDEGNAIFLSKKVKKSLKSTDKIITISEHSRGEIMGFYGVPRSNIYVARPATDQKLFYKRSVQEIEKIKQLYGIDGDYILALSNLEPRKNLDSLVKAYCELPEKYTKKTGLLLVGVSGWKTDKLFNDIIGRVNDGFNIMRPSSYVSDEHKAAIISGAKMLVYPSHYEGFGMPPLEALACGVPVICADNSSLPEAVGKVAKLIDGNNVGQLRDAIIYCLDNHYAISQKTITEGPSHADNFSWLNSAQVYIDVAGESG